MNRPFAWDFLSDQPHRFRDVNLRKQLRRRWLPELAACWYANLLLAVPTLAHYLARPTGNCSLVIGVGIDPLTTDPRRLADLLDRLGCQHVLVRFEWRTMHRWSELWEAIDRIGRPTMAVLIQDRAAITDHRRWLAGLTRFYQRMSHRIDAVQATHAVNRLKWGPAFVGEAMPLVRMARAWHHRFAPNLPFLGPGLIDFEPVLTGRSLITPTCQPHAGLATALYVDRRGGPEGTQYGIFNLKNKIRLLSAMSTAAQHGPLWINEFNWPLTGQGAYAPTSAKECVDEATAGAYTAEFLRLARASGQVARVYHWQLVARGYGLVDPDGMRPRPAFAALAQALGATS